MRYLCAPAEKLPLPDHSASLITAAQAAHWFDLPAFYNEVRRIAVTNAPLALISYGAPHLEPALDTRFQSFYHNDIGPYWPAERQLVDTGYTDIPFPFTEHKTPAMDIRRQWNLHEFLGYVSTWSAIRRAREAGQDQLLQTFSKELGELWGDAEYQRPVVWPVRMRVGRV